MSAFALLAACAAPDATRLYLLEAPSSDDAAASQSPAPRLIGLREVGLPLYARRPQIAVLGPDGAIEVMDNQRWAEDPPRAATRLLTRALERSGAGEVFAEPWPLSVQPDVIVTIDVDRFVGALNGPLRLEGDFSIVARGDRGAPAKRRFEISVQSENASFTALTSAHGAALAELSDLITVTLNE